MKLNELRLSGAQGRPCLPYTHCGSWCLFCPWISNCWLLVQGYQRGRLSWSSFLSMFMLTQQMHPHRHVQITVVDAYGLWKCHDDPAATRMSHPAMRKEEPSQYCRLFRAKGDDGSLCLMSQTRMLKEGRHALQVEPSRPQMAHQQCRTVPSPTTMLGSWVVQLQQMALTHTRRNASSQVRMASAYFIYHG